MKLFWLLALALLGAPERGVLEPRVHFLHGYPGGDPMLVYYQAKGPLELKSVTIAGLTIKSWRFVTAFKQRSLELEIDPKPGLNVEWNSLSVVEQSGQAQVLAVAPSRAMYLPERPSYEISFERMEQLPNDRLYLGLRLFNDSNQPVTLERFLYAPTQASAQRVLLEPGYDPRWFDKLEAWRKQSGSSLPNGAKLLNSEALNLVIPPSKGVSAAVVGASFKPTFSCSRAGVQRDPAKRVDSAFLQPVMQYRVGAGKSQFYPIPDAIIADLCP